MFAKYSQLFDLLFVSSMTTLLSALRARAAIATDKETQYTTYNQNAHYDGNKHHRLILPIRYHMSSVIW